MSQTKNKSFNAFLIIIFFLNNSIFCVPFVTKRVSLHNPIHIDFSGWIPLRPQKTDPMETQESKPETIVTNLDSHYLTVPVAVETDLEHVLSQKDLSQIQEQVMNSWNKNHFNLNSDSIPQQLKPFLLNKLLPKNSEELIPQNNNNNNNETEYTFVKMDKTLEQQLNNNSTNDSTNNENLFHAYFGPKDHVPPEGYIRLSKEEFKNLFKNAEILFV